MAFVEADRVQVRRFLGYAQINLEADPRLESALDSAQSIADGGSRPDSTAENMIKALLVKLIALDEKIDELDCLENIRMDKIEVDAVRAYMVLCQHAFKKACQLADALNTKPIRNIWSQGKLLEPGEPTFTRRHSQMAWRS